MFGDAAVSRKEDRSPVTEADLAVQEALLASIEREHPADAVIAEETRSGSSRHASPAKARRCWAVDPIDGTRNYAHGLPIFTLSVAMLEAGRPVIGWIYDPVVGRMYSASLGAGAWIDDRPIERAERPDFGGPFISVPTSRDEGLPRLVHDWIDRMTVRNFGSTALHLAMLAAGGLDAVYARRPRLWDVAAGAVIAGETGAHFVTPDGTPHFPMDMGTYENDRMPFIASRPPLLDQLVQEYRASAT